MGDATGIEWCDATWNPVVGCSVVSPGCTNCYAMRMAARLEKMGQPIYQGLTRDSKAGAVWSGKVELSSWGQVIKPLSWKRPRRIFVNSMSDLFHESLPDAAIDQVFAVMWHAPQHTFQILTKRAERMRDYLRGDRISKWMILGAELIRSGAATACGIPKKPMPHVWLGVSVEDQARADERIPLLLETPAATRFLSCEPLLGPLDLTQIAVPDATAGKYAGHGYRFNALQREDDLKLFNAPRHIDWVIAGAESGYGARPCDQNWVRDLRDQCEAAGVPLFYKQHAERGRKIPLPMLDGRQHVAFPVTP